MQQNDDPTSQRTDDRDDADTSDELTALSRYIFETGHLKLSPRTGWWLAGVRDSESVAEHIFRTSVIGFILATLEGANAERTALMCVLHDVIETRTGDIPSVGKKYLTKAKDDEIASDQSIGWPDRVRDALLELVEEYEGRSTKEARLARDADKIECLAQALEYKASGYPQTEQWIYGSYCSIGSQTGRDLADALKATPPNEWWRSFVANYKTEPAVDPEEKKRPS